MNLINAHYVDRSLNHEYFDLLKSKIESGLIQSSMGTDASSPSKAKQTIKDIQEKIKLFLINAKIFEKGIKTFTGLFFLFKIVFILLSEI